jgi:hypothetical protein
MKANTITDLTFEEKKCLQLLNQELIENSENEFIKEQYKLFIDSAHKIAERNKDTNTIHITVSSIFIPFLIKSFDIEPLNLIKIMTVTCLITTGLIICINWLRVIKTYGSINHNNYLIINAFEKHLPTSVFSLRAKISATANDEGNLVPYKEKCIPYIFITIYFFLYIIFFTTLNEKNITWLSLINSI